MLASKSISWGPITVNIDYDIVKIFEEKAVDIPRDFIVFREMGEAISWLEK